MHTANRMNPFAFGNAPVCVLCLLAVAAGAARAQQAADWASQICPAGATRDCYVRLDHPENCYFWLSVAVAKLAPKGTTRSWSGACEGGLAQGEGTLSSDLQGRLIKAIGSVEKGRPQGSWVRLWSDGAILEGPYRDGQKHGPWIERLPGGTVAEGPYRDGQRHGQWVWRRPDGNVVGGSYLDGRKHGPWVERWPGGSVEEGAYRDGKRQGPWAVRLPGGAVHETNYRDGEPAR